MKNKIRGWLRSLAFVAALASAAGAWGFTFILNDSTGLPVKWAPGSVPIRIMLGTTENLSDGTSFNSTAAAAAKLWNVQIGAVQYVSTLAAPAPASQTNNVNELVFAADVFGKSFDDTVLAITTGYYSGNERRPSDIVFNTAYTWNSYRGARQGSTVDLRRVATHELGHLLGLDHPDDAGQNVSAIMNSKVGNLDALTVDDIQGIQSIYGPPGIPPNNDFAKATDINFSGGKITVTGYNTNATKEAGEPNHAGNAGGRSVWWRWKPGVAGQVTIDTKGSYYDTTLAIYTGSSLGSLTSIASDDDITDGVVQASTVTFTVDGNTTYLIAVDGFNGDSNGADCGGIKLNLDFAPVSGLAPAITSQPASVTADVGGNASFSVTATGSAPLAYQWYFNSVAINGATNATYSLANLQTSQAGSYYVTVANAAGSTLSGSVTLTVRTPTSPAPSSGGGGGGGGGGGAPSDWFCAVLALLGLGRCLQRVRR